MTPLPHGLVHGEAHAVHVDHGAAHLGLSAQVKIESKIEANLKRN
jgi:hypothetical protein